MMVWDGELDGLSYVQYGTVHLVFTIEYLHWNIPQTSDGYVLQPSPPLSSSRPLPLPAEVDSHGSKTEPVELNLFCSSSLYI